MRAFLLGASLIITALPAQAALNVFGSSLARQCYEAAMTGSGTGAALCERALDDNEMTARDRAATLVNRGIIYNAARQLDLAIADFDAALQINPNLGEAYLNRGNAHFWHKQFPEAIADYGKAIDLKSGSLDYAHYNKALAEMNIGKFQDAKADLTAALAITPQFKAASDRMAEVDKAIAAQAASPTPAPQPPATTRQSTTQQ
ncbi:MAG TPA: tetratricopeptide repeat protein [Alphaproteobacteria bacterium]|nr:tetratricopeptide repeat protein [Alphaproteobacteria bacterium]